MTSIAKWERELRAISSSVVAIERGRHFRLILANGRFVVAAVTPGERFALKKIAAQVRREMAGHE